MRACLFFAARDFIRSPKLRFTKRPTEICTGARTDTFTSRPYVLGFISFLKTLFSELASDTQMRVLDEHLIWIAAV